MSKHKQNKAVALRYRTDNDAAPVVIASGYGPIAERIIDVAEQKGIPVFRDDSAASLLCMLDIGRTIPPDLYEVVAAIYCRILDISKDIRKQQAATAKTPEQQRTELIDRLEKLEDKRNGGRLDDV